MKDARCAYGAGLRTGVDTEYARPCRRRAMCRVATGLLLTGLMFLCPVELRAEGPDPVKDTLREIKDLACGLADLLFGMEGPVSDPDIRDIVKADLDRVVELSTDLLSDPTGPLYASGPMCASFCSIDTTGMNLSEMATEGCEAACRALEEYCEWLESGSPSTLTSAIQALWQVVDIAPDIFEAAGVTE